MAYYCFLCNENHEGTSTKEHFIPKSMGVPKSQYLPVCEASNGRSNSVFDNDSRDILYLARNPALKRTGEALLNDGSTRDFTFSYIENVQSGSGARFDYIYDKTLNKEMPTENVYAIIYSVGLSPEEKVQLCRGLSKISIGALAYLLKGQGIKSDVIKKMFSQVSISTLRDYALNYPLKSSTDLKFLIGRTNILLRLQNSCNDSKKRNHVIEISFNKDNSIHIEGMLHSKYGWAIDCPNEIIIRNKILRLENPIDRMAPEPLKDLTSTYDRICIINPSYSGVAPEIPVHWRN